MQKKSRHSAGFFVSIKLSSVNEGFAVGALAFGGVVFVSFDLDSFKGAAVTVFAVMLAVIDGAADIGVCFSHKNASLINLLLVFAGGAYLCRKTVLIFAFFHINFLTKKFLKEG